MAQVGQTPTANTTASGPGGPGNAFAFNAGNEPVPGVPAPGDGDPHVDSDAQPAPELLQARDEASRFGWVDKDAWEAEGRNPERWRDAPEFLEVRRGIAKIANEENAAQRAEIAVLKQKLAERERRETEAQGRYTIDTLKLERKQAREEGNWDKVDEIDEKIDALRQEQAKIPPQPTMAPELQAQLVSFRDQNAWLQSDPDLAADFTRELKAYVDAGTPLDRALQRARARIVRDNPAKFGQVARPRFAMSETGGNSGSVTGNGKEWQNIRPDWRKQAEADIAKGKYTREQYLASARETPEAWTK